MEPLPTFVPLEVYNELRKSYDYIKIDNERLQKDVKMYADDLYWREIDDKLKAGLFPFKNELDFHRDYPAKRKAEWKKRFAY